MSQFHLIAPSGYCINQSAALRGVSRLEEAGHQVAHQQVIARRDRRFAGTENERLGDVNGYWIASTGRGWSLANSAIRCLSAATAISPLSRWGYWPSATLSPLAGRCWPGTSVPKR